MSQMICSGRAAATSSTKFTSPLSLMRSTISVRAVAHRLLDLGDLPRGESAVDDHAQLRVLRRVHVDHRAEELGDLLRDVADVRAAAARCEQVRMPAHRHHVFVIGDGPPLELVGREQPLRLGFGQHLRDRRARGRRRAGPRCLETGRSARSLANTASRRGPDPHLGVAQVDLVDREVGFGDGVGTRHDRDPTGWSQPVVRDAVCQSSARGNRAASPSSPAAVSRSTTWLPDGDDSRSRLERRVGHGARHRRRLVVLGRHGPDRSRPAHRVDHAGQPGACSTTSVASTCSPSRPRAAFGATGPSARSCCPTTSSLRGSRRRATTTPAATRCPGSTRRGGREVVATPGATHRRRRSSTVACTSRRSGPDSRLPPRSASSPPWATSWA